MKTERRHELQTNTLADVLGHKIEKIRPHSTKLLIAGIVVVTVIITIAMISQDRQSALAEARNDLFLALAKQDRDALKDVSKTHSGTPVSWWAKVAQADLDLTNGLTALYINRDEAFQSLDDAKKAYTEIINSGTNNPDQVRHALFGLASAHEASSNLEKAREYYQRVVQEHPDSPVAIEARNRLEALKDPQTEKWYSWFARQKPKPRTSQPGPTGMPTGLGSLPNYPDLGPLNIPAQNESGAATEPTSGADTKSTTTSETKEDADAKGAAAPPAKPDADAPPATPEATEKPKSTTSPVESPDSGSNSPAKPPSENPSP